VPLLAARYRILDKLPVPAVNRRSVRRNPRTCISAQVPACPRKSPTPPALPARQTRIFASLRPRNDGRHRHMGSLARYCIHRVSENGLSEKRMPATPRLAAVSG
jgi:hypothetical protein